MHLCKNRPRLLFQNLKMIVYTYNFKNWLIIKKWGQNGVTKEMGSEMGSGLTFGH